MTQLLSFSVNSTRTPLPRFFRPVKDSVKPPANEPLMPATPSTSLVATPAIICTTSSAIWTEPRSVSSYSMSATLITLLIIVVPSSYDKLRLKYVILLQEASRHIRTAKLLVLHQGDVKRNGCPNAIDFILVQSREHPSNRLFARGRPNDELCHH